MACQRLCGNLTRRKPIEVLLSDSPLRRFLTTIDLTSLGVGAIVGAGLYVVAGELARDVAGPAVVLSFLLASITALLCVLSYAEFSSRIPKAGSAYIYTYVTLGEIWAFIVGWNVILEYVISGASLARACSEYIDAVCQGEIYHFFMHDIVTWNHPGIAPFPDFLAAALVVAVVTLVCLGVRSSANVQKAVTVGNFIVIFFMIVYGIFFANFENWTRKFIPYGIQGVLRGAASAFFAFAGFDIVTTAAAEAIYPQRNIPLSLLLIVTISTMSYMGVTTVLTLMLPYQELDPFAPLAKAFAQGGNFPAAKYIVACGGICATISALVCVVFSPSRILYSMSVDGLFFRWFSQVNEKTHAPIRATVISGSFSAVLALIFDINQLVELLSIGTLLAYSMVTISVLVSRYQPGVQSVYENSASETKARTGKWLQSLYFKPTAAEDDSPVEVSQATYQPIRDEEESLDDNDNSSKKEANQSTAFCVKLSVIFLVAGIIGLVIVLSKAFTNISKAEWWAIFLICLSSGTIVVSLVAIQLQPQNSAKFPFMTPGVPYTPAVTIFINVLLLAHLQWTTYLRFGIWMAVGFVIYFLYGYHNSTEALKPAIQKEGEFVLPETPDIQSFVNKPQAH